ncbi:MAG: YbaB/EbfC family nucleoid-associated protein [Gammaproteobacteria bacterium]|nr:YbaB/EbfC family nucleoid-associated protein [Gammaproteobacteria bacterium]
MKAGLGQIMKQAQKMQADMQKAQEELANIEVVGEAGGGMVKITMNCRNAVRGISIDEGLTGEDRDMLEDLLAAAFNDALRKVEETTREKMSGMTAGLNLPGGLNLPF